MNEYVIEVKARGYETYELVGRAASKGDARTEVSDAVTAWCKLNDVGNEATGLAFVSIRLKIERSVNG